MANENLDAAATYFNDVAMKYVDFTTDIFLLSVNLLSQPTKVRSSFFEGFAPEPKDDTDNVTDIKKKPSKK